MIISAASDYRAAAQRILPPFLFHYIDGGAYAEHTLRRNVEDLSDVALRQRILRNMSDLSLETTLFNEKLAMPTALAPVGLCGMYARRGECRPARRTTKAFRSPSTVSVCPIEEVAPTIKRPMVPAVCPARPRLYAQCAERAKAAGCSTLVFTVDMPTPGARYRDAHSGMSGPNACAATGRPSPIRSGRGTSALTVARTIWAISPPISANRPGLRITLAGWRITSIRRFHGKTGVDPRFLGRSDGDQGILDPEDARDAVRFGADGIVVSNHGGRQLDGVLSARALPAIADAVKATSLFSPTAASVTGSTWCG